MTAATTSGRLEEGLLLRRIKPISAVPAPETEFAAEFPELDQTVPDQTETLVLDRRKVERRKIERRSLDDLRSEFHDALGPEDEEKVGAVRFKAPGGLAMKPSRILLLLVALIAGGSAAYLATRGEPQVASQSAPKVVQEPRTQVLVAKQTIAAGQRLTPETVGWEDWPQTMVRQGFVTEPDSPQAISDFTGSVARVDIFAGDPIRPQKLAQATGGFLSTILDQGMRAVSVSVSAGSASGGFISPNDHVDVVLTRPSPIGHESETILHNIRVLAINARLGNAGANGAPAEPATPSADVFTNQAIATLELDPTQAEVIINATTIGSLVLVLRSATDFAEARKSEQSSTNQAIRITSPFWLK